MALLKKMQIPQESLEMPEKPTVMQEIMQELLIQRPGWPVVAARPTDVQYGKGFWIDLADALGHSISTNSMNRSATASPQIVLSWLAVEDIETVAITSANYLTGNMLISIVAALTGAGITTWLLYDIDPTEDRQYALDGLGAEEVLAAQFLLERRNVGVVAAIEPKTPFPSIPDVHFLGFHQIAKEILDTNSFAIVESRYREGLEKMRAWASQADELTEETVAARMHEITSGVGDLNELTAIVKGAQVGAFTQGWNVKVEMKRFAERATFTNLPMPLSADDWSKLNQMRRPCESATCVLTAIGIDKVTLSELRYDAVEPDGSIVHLGEGDVIVPPEGRKILMAQHVFRVLEVGDSDDHFLVKGWPKSGTTTAKWVANLLRLTTRDTGIVFRVKSAQEEGRGAHWTRRIGVSVGALRCN